MGEIDKLRAIGQAEFENHGAEFERLQGVVEHILVSMDWHREQMNRWNEYLGSLVTPGVQAIILQFPEQPDPAA